jgi:hypothetical protein
MEAATTGEIASPSVVDLFVGCFLGAWRYALSTSDKETPHECSRVPSSRLLSRGS